MATYTSTLSNNSNYYITLTITETVPSDYISTNKTNVNYNLTMTKTSGSGYWDDAARNNVRVVINGSTVVNRDITYDFRGSTPKTITLASGTVNGISHNNDGKKTINVSGSFTDPTGDLGSATASGTFKLKDIPRGATVTSAPDFNDEENPTIQYSNPAGTLVTSIQGCISVDNSTDTVPYRDLEITGSSYTFNLTTAERNALRNATPNSNTITVYFRLKTVLGNDTFYTSVSKTMSIVNANPVFNDFTFDDINPTTLALTGNSKYNINGYSTIQATISTLNKAIAQKGATMSFYKLVIGDKSENVNYSDDSQVVVNIANAPIGTYQVYATDSRGNSTVVSKVSSNEITYEPIYIDRNRSEVYRGNGGISGDGYLKYQGTIANVNFGATTNSITNATYEFKKTDSQTWILGTTDITPTITNNDFSFNDIVRSNNQDYKFDLDASYNFRITIEDALSIRQVELTPMANTIPNISINKDGVGIMCDYDNSTGGLLQVGGNIVDGLQHFSDTKKQIGYWIDGNPLYEIWVEKTVSSNTTDRYSLSDLGITNQDVIIIDLGKSTAHFDNTTGVAYSPVSYYVTSTDRAHVWIDGSSRLAIANVNGNSRDYYIRILFTEVSI